MLRFYDILLNIIKHLLFDKYHLTIIKSKKRTSTHTIKQTPTHTQIMEIVL